MKADTDETIAAIATPQGRAALGIIRISGKACNDIINRLFLPAGKERIVPFKPVLGRIRLTAETFLDEAVLIYYRAPRSYTREDVAEITCHGNPLILEQVLEALLSHGARLARPGEFTFRAFLNGRLDLVQAAAVDDLINADSVYQAELALQQLDGRLSARLQQLRQSFLELISLMEGNIDFSEEQHYHFIDQQQALQRHDSLLAQLLELLGTFERGRIIREGYRVALVGRPNVGKSSLFNALLGKNRAIVTAKPGTTRDYLQERLTIGPHLMLLLDTAGIRQSEEEVEKEGVRRSLQVIENAELILFVADGGESWTTEDRLLWAETEGKDRIVVWNKSDLPNFAQAELGEQTVCVSAKNGSGLDDLLEKVKSRIDARVRNAREDQVLSNLRHRDILKSAVAAVERSRDTLQRGLSEEFVLLDLRAAVDHIGEITGQVTIDDVYTQIFSNFCIGK